MIGVGEPAPVNTHKDIVKYRFLAIRDSPDFKIVKNLAARAYGNTEVFMGIGAEVGFFQGLGIIKELFAQPLGGHFRVAAPMSQRSPSRSEYILVGPILPRYGRVEALENHELCPATHDRLLDGSYFFLPGELVQLFKPKILEIAVRNLDRL